MGKVRGAEAAAWLRFDWCIGLRLGAVDFRGSRAATSTTYVLLGFGTVVSSIRLDRLVSTSSMLAGEILQLIGLAVSDLRGVIDMVIDEVLIGHVDQGTHIDARGCDEGQAPEWNHLDEPVGKKGRGKAGNSVDDIFGKEDTLELNDEEVDELLDVL